ncbi:uncharacterized protein BDR25DRAFT_315128 [Lindgomyces ingoldianus]|uniref:Uncharacterized protein n=1 Tax=Lindgomyces ingoldianus TaxID=673940 RepID=A0ACB6QTQ9_9PLEO|nr:uncharacterized protein BDR25DRAFT_315128 [Lindgomyces ingoldianus]KAF2469915.1 hypothetical protein BDR25DRAFT_315128 [Lindgomyces ingoldianus]
MEQFEFGTKPPKPSVVNASFADGKLTINIEEGAKRVSFMVKINLPTNSSDGPFPAIIAYGAASIPLNNTGIATIIFNNDQLGQQSNGRGVAWAWGVSRVIDALEFLGSDVTKIDVQRLGVTGCSRNAKGALVAGALDFRIALTIPQEAGQGGSGCWRLYRTCRGHCIPETQPIYVGNNWFRRDFPSNIGLDFNRLPFDHHELIGLVAPRGLLIIENDIDWLNPESTTVCSRAGKMLYEALGESSSFGFSLVGSHPHCQFPVAQMPELQAFLDRYMFRNESADTEVFKSAITVSVANYVDWKLPILE